MLRVDINLDFKFAKPVVFTRLTMSADPALMDSSILELPGPPSGLNLTLSSPCRKADESELTEEKVSHMEKIWELTDFGKDLRRIEVQEQKALVVKIKKKFDKAMDKSFGVLVASMLVEKKWDDLVNGTLEMPTRDSFQYGYDNASGPSKSKRGKEDQDTSI